MGPYNIKFGYHANSWRIHHQAIIKSLETIIDKHYKEPEQSISRLQILPEDELNKILYDWNDTDVEYPEDKTIHQLFEEQVDRTPDSIAVIFEDQSLTYRKLNQRSNQLAHYLQYLGVKAESLVAVCLERSIEMIISILAILKAGGAYVPLDPNYPKERLKFLLDDIGTDTVLSPKKELVHFRNIFHMLQLIVSCAHSFYSHLPLTILMWMRATTSVARHMSYTHQVRLANQRKLLSATAV